MAERRLGGRIDDLRTELKAEIAELRTEVAAVKADVADNRGMLEKLLGGQAILLQNDMELRRRLDAR